MEQWEKDYIDQIQQMKHAEKYGKKYDSSYKGGYDSSRWIEVKSADGTKNYILKKGAFKPDKARRQITFYISIWLRRTLKAVVVAALVILVYPRMAKRSEKFTHQTQEYRPVTLQSTIEGQITRKTYVDGYGLHDMMDFFEETNLERNEMLSEVTWHYNGLVNMDVDAWEKRLQERAAGFASLKYDDSYGLYVSVQKDAFALQQRLLDEVKNNGSVEEIISLENDISEKTGSLRSILLKAFDDNQVKYSVGGDESLTYWYMQY